MSSNNIQTLISQKQGGMQAFDSQIASAQAKGDDKLVEGLQRQKHEIELEVNQLQSEALPNAQKEEAEQREKEAAEQARKDQKKDDLGKTLLKF